MHTGSKHPGLWLLLFTALAGSIVGAGAFWARLAFSLRADQPLSITACTPDTWTTPDPGSPGPRQEDCDHWFTLANDQHPASQPVTVVGQVCLDSEEPIAYMVNVSWWQVGGAGAKANVVNVPITWEPGCNEPYEFDYTFPRSKGRTGDSLGKWRLVGQAEPVHPDRYLRYQWDVTHTVELIDS